MIGTKKINVAMWLNILEEFLVKCLTDPNLNIYVIKPEKVLRNILSKESN